MPYGTIKVDTVTFTDAGVDKSVSISGLVQNPTFSGNVTVTGTISGVTVTGTTASFTSGNFTNISGGTHTITSGVFAAGSAANPSISFTSDPNTGIYSPGADQVAISTNGTGRLFIDASGRVGVGTTPSTLLHIQSTDPAFRFKRSDAGTDAYGELTTDTSGLVTIKCDPANAAAGSGFRVTVDNSETLRVDSSGRLLVGTSTARGNFFNTTGLTPGIQLEGSSFQNRFLGLISSDNGGPGSCAGIIMARQKSGSVGGNTIVANNDSLGLLTFQGSDGTEFVDGARIEAFVDGTPGNNDMPGRLVFSTTADGASSPTERMRLINSGFLKVSNDGSYQSTTSGNHEFTNTLDSDSLVVRSTNASYSGNGILALATRNTTNNSFYAFSYYNSGASAYRFRIADSGNATNTNNSYGAISDAKLKENIVDATSQWSDIKALQVRKYNFKKETGQQTHTQIGLIAQEVELVSPGLVSESPDRDAEGNDLGTVTKSVNYSVLYMKAVKALQEAMERIETLEAKVAALESA